jgi:Fur family ferric uptake transcriptional regulator
MNSGSSFEHVKELFSEHLEKNQLRKTPERFAILDEVYSRNEHFDVDELFESMKAKNYRVSRATVYNTLDLLVDCNLVRKHQFGSSLAQYEKSVGHSQHHHLICNQCQQVTEFCEPRLHHIHMSIGDLLGFSIRSHSFILHGDCTRPDCLNKQVSPPQQSSECHD